MGFRQTFHTFYGCRQKYTDMWSFTGGSVVKNPPANAEDADLGSVLGQEDPLEEEIATHSSIHAWKIPWTEESGKLQSIGSQRVGHSATEHTLHILTCINHYSIIHCSFIQSSLTALNIFRAPPIHPSPLPPDTGQKWLLLSCLFWLFQNVK